jgi:hypothetical protein
MNSVGQWPPVYDFETLAAQIKSLVSSYGIFDIFFQNNGPVNVALCQGDVIQFRSPFPLIDEAGDISYLDEGYSSWVIIGNTCDLDRAINDSEYSQVSPLMELAADEPGPILEKLKSYRSNRRFFVPSWSSAAHPGYYVDFTKMCSIHKSCLFNDDLVKVSARMSFLSWVLFHSCIVRYLARYDGRHT